MGGGGGGDGIRYLSRRPMVVIYINIEAEMAECVETAIWGAYYLGFGRIFQAGGKMYRDRTPGLRLRSVAVRCYPLHFRVPQ